MNITNEINTSNMIKLEIEKYLNDNHLSYNNAVRNDLGELVGIGDLIYNKTKELQERVEELESELKLIKTKRTNYLSFLKQRNELKNDNIKLQAKVDEFENFLKTILSYGSTGEDARDIKQYVSEKLTN